MFIKPYDGSVYNVLLSQKIFSELRDSIISKPKFRNATLPGEIVERRVPGNVLTLQNRTYAQDANNK